MEFSSGDSQTSVARRRRQSRLSADGVDIGSGTQERMKTVDDFPLLSSTRKQYNSPTDDFPLLSNHQRKVTSSSAWSGEKKASVANLYIKKATTKRNDGDFFQQSQLGLHGNAVTERITSLPPRKSIASESSLYSTSHNEFPPNTTEGTGLSIPKIPPPRQTRTSKSSYMIERDNSILDQGPTRPVYNHSEHPWADFDAFGNNAEPKKVSLSTPKVAVESDMAKSQNARVSKFNTSDKSSGTFGADEDPSAKPGYSSTQHPKIWRLYKPRSFAKMPISLAEETPTFEKEQDTLLLDKGKESFNRYDLQTQDSGILVVKESTKPASSGRTGQQVPIKEPANESRDSESRAVDSSKNQVPSQDSELQEILADLNSMNRDGHGGRLRRSQGSSSVSLEKPKHGAVPMAGVPHEAAHKTDTSRIESIAEATESQVPNDREEPFINSEKSGDDSHEDTKTVLSGTSGTSATVFVGSEEVELVHTAQPSNEKLHQEKQEGNEDSKEKTLEEPSPKEKTSWASSWKSKVNILNRQEKRKEQARARNAGVGKSMIFLLAAKKMNQEISSSSTSPTVTTGDPTEEETEATVSAASRDGASLAATDSSQTRQTGSNSNESTTTDDDSHESKTSLSGESVLKDDPSEMPSQAVSAVGEEEFMRLAQMVCLPHGLVQLQKKNSANQQRQNQGDEDDAFSGLVGAGWGKEAIEQFSSTMTKLSPTFPSLDDHHSLMMDIEKEARGNQTGSSGRNKARVVPASSCRNIRMGGGQNSSKGGASRASQELKSTKGRSMKFVNQEDGALLNARPNPKGPTATVVNKGKKAATKKKKKTRNLGQLRKAKVLQKKANSVKIFQPTKNLSSRSLYRKDSSGRAFQGTQEASLQRQRSANSIPNQGGEHVLIDSLPGKKQVTFDVVNRFLNPDGCAGVESTKRQGAVLVDLDDAHDEWEAKDEYPYAPRSYIPSEDRAKISSDDDILELHSLDDEEEFSSDEDDYTVESDTDTDEYDDERSEESDVGEALRTSMADLVLKVADVFEVNPSASIFDDSSVLSAPNVPDKAFYGFEDTNQMSFD